MAALISIVVPVFNEAPLIARSLQLLRDRAAGAELIVVDGGSSDATAEIATGLCDRLLSVHRGRARQMNAGAAAARGDVLWFLHADAEPPENCLTAIETALAQPEIAGGYFRIRLPRRQFVYRFTDCFAHRAGQLLRMRCGDHGFFCRRELFERIGGFPDVPLMEDVEFFRAMRRRGRIAEVPLRLVVDARRYEAVGPMRLTLAFGLIATLYMCRAPWPLLAGLYRRLCCGAATEKPSCASIDFS